jgi:hypothetical protein
MCTSQCVQDVAVVKQVERSMSCCMGAFKRAGTIVQKPFQNAAICMIYSVVLVEVYNC